MILIVASHVGTRDALVLLISAEGYLVEAIDCGDEVLRRLRFQRPSTLILDCDLADNFAMLAKIRADYRTPSIPIVMYSESGANLKEKALGQGADAFICRGSLDWAELFVEIVRFAGPPPKKTR